MLPKRIEDFLNSGDAVVVETSPQEAELTSFVQVRPLPKPGVPREERRYLNSTWSRWEYWDFEFRRVILRRGWRDDEEDYDRYIVEDSRVLTVDETTFDAALRNWVVDTDGFLHTTESSCPL
jgi:hypothetical protein